MPFTFSHPAAILPLRWLPKRWLSLTGLVVGSMTPDFEYFIRMKVDVQEAKIDKHPSNENYKMDITYLKDLNDNPTHGMLRGIVLELKPLTMDEIINLEATYNNGQVFPTALRELLYLAGNYCYVLDYGLYNSQSEMQDGARRFLLRENLQINRPFFAIDMYNQGDGFLFVYLDESINDPTVHQMWYDDRQVYSLNCTLSEFIHSKMLVFLSGKNPQ